MRAVQGSSSSAAGGALADDMKVLTWAALPLFSEARGTLTL